MRMVISILKPAFTKKWKGAIVKTRFLIGCAMKRKARERKERTRIIVEAMFPGIHARSKLPRPSLPPPLTGDQLVQAWKQRSKLKDRPSPLSLSPAERQARIEQAKRDYPQFREWPDEDFNELLDLGMI